MSANASDFSLFLHYFKKPKILKHSIPQNMPVLEESQISIVLEDGDIAYEEDIIRNPYSLRCWIRYIDHKKHASKSQINMIYERALKELPGSYKLWYNYLKLRRKQMRARCIIDPGFEDVNNCFERALVFMHKMPRIWMDYCQWMTHQRLVTRTRKIFDRALRALPITQHSRIWPLYLKFVREHDIPETAMRVFRRHLKLAPDNSEEFIDFLTSINRLDEASLQLAKIVNDDKFCSKQGKTNHQLWQELCDLMSQNPSEVTSLKVEPIIRQGLKRFTDQTGKLWCALADYYIRAGLFEKARDIYEEAIQTICTVRDFSQIFDAYAQFEERLISGKMEALKSDDAVSDEQELDLDLKLIRLENLMDRRPLLLNRVLLRQNPHNVFEWHNRVKLYEDKGKKNDVIDAYTEAVKTVDPKLQTGKLSSLWVAFAKFYENHNQVEDARLIFQEAVSVSFAKVDELATIWCEFAEMELRHNNIKAAIKLMKEATQAPRKQIHYFDETEPVQNRVYKSLKLWSMYADLEESFGSFESCKAVYDRIIDLRISTPQIIFNYGMFLEEHNHFEDAFRVYEQGVALFKWPNVFDIWNVYLTKFIKRYGSKSLEGQKLERARDLFCQCLDDCPSQFAKNFYLLWARMEEDYGQPRRAMEVYEKATSRVLKEEMYEIFNVYLKKAAELYGVTYTRPIYEKAIEELPPESARDMCLRFADMERKLGEIDRARAIYSHCSQLCDPRVLPSFWETWKEFEVKHGNEDTLREMLRVKRSVQATFNTQVNFMSAQMLAATGGGAKAAPDLSAADSMALLEAKALQLADETKQAPSGGNIMFVSGGTSQVEDSSESAPNKRIVETRNPDEIDLDDDEMEEEDQTAQGVQVEKQVIPSEVFGSLAEEEEND